MIKLSLISQLANGSPLLTPKDDNLRHMNGEHKADYFIFLGLYEGGEKKDLWKMTED